MRLNIPGEEYALSWQEYLENQKQDQCRRQESGRPGRRRGGGGLRDHGQAARRALGGVGLSPQAGEHAADGLRAGDAAGARHRDFQLLQAARDHP